MRLRAAACAVLLLAAVPGPVQAAGLFDLLLGAPAPPAPPPVQDDGALTVHPRQAPGRPRKPRAASAAADHPRQVAIDPSKVPDWYLKDRTLRRGDIIVLKHDVLVVTGAHGALRQPEDFARLGDAHGISKQTRDFVAKATAANAYTALAVAPAKPEPKPRSRHRGTTEEKTSQRQGSRKAFTVTS